MTSYDFFLVFALLPWPILTYSLPSQTKKSMAEEGGETDRLNLVDEARDYVYAHPELKMTALESLDDLHQTFNDERERLLRQFIYTIVAKQLQGRFIMLKYMDHHYLHDVIIQSMPRALDFTCKEINAAAAAVFEMGQLMREIGKVHRDVPECAGFAFVLDPVFDEHESNTDQSTWADCAICREKVPPIQVFPWCSNCETNNPICVGCLSKALRLSDKCPTCNATVITMAGFQPLIPISRRRSEQEVRPERNTALSVLLSMITEAAIADTESDDEEQQASGV